MTPKEEWVLQCYGCAFSAKDGRRERRQSDMMVQQARTLEEAIYIWKNLPFQVCDMCQYRLINMTTGDFIVCDLL